jgi:hypothetical protein
LATGTVQKSEPKLIAHLLQRLIGDVSIGGRWVQGSDLRFQVAVVGGLLPTPQL